MQYQPRFIEIIKSMVPVHVSLAHEMSALLDISIDSAYRRLRCETPITLEEAVKLCFRFDVPLEALNSGIPEVVTCHYHLMYQDEHSLGTYLQALHQHVLHIGKDDKAMIHYAAEDIPVFYHFGYPPLLHFKLFYWRKSILNHASLRQLRYEDYAVSPEDAAMCQAIHDTYQQIASAEIWTEQTAMSTLQQIRFYWDAGFFREKTSALALCEAMHQLLRQIKTQADAGLKRQATSFRDKPYSLYQSDLMIGNNGVVVELKDRMTVFLGYLSFNFIRADNKDFALQNKIWMEHLKAKSTLISAVSEKQRNQFFKTLGRQVDALMQYVEVDGYSTLLGQNA